MQGAPCAAVTFLPKWLCKVSTDSDISVAQQAGYSTGSLDKPQKQVREEFRRFVKHLATDAPNGFIHGASLYFFYREVDDLCLISGPYASLDDARNAGNEACKELEVGLTEDKRQAIRDDPEHSMQQLHAQHQQFSALLQQHRSASIALSSSSSRAWTSQQQQHHHQQPQHQQQAHHQPDQQLQHQQSQGIYGQHSGGPFDPADVQVQPLRTAARSSSLPGARAGRSLSLAPHTGAVRHSSNSPVARSAPYQQRGRSRSPRASTTSAGSGDRSAQQTPSTSVMRSGSIGSPRSALQQQHGLSSSPLGRNSSAGLGDWSVQPAPSFVRRSSSIGSPRSALQQQHGPSSSPLARNSSAGFADWSAQPAPPTDATGVHAPDAVNQGWLDVQGAPPPPPAGYAAAASSTPHLHNLLQGQPMQTAASGPAAHAYAATPMQQVPPSAPPTAPGPMPYYGAPDLQQHGGRHKLSRFGSQQQVPYSSTTASYAAAHTQPLPGVPQQQVPHLSGYAFRPAAAAAGPDGNMQPNMQQGSSQKAAQQQVQTGTPWGSGAHASSSQGPHPVLSPGSMAPAAAAQLPASAHHMLSLGMPHEAAAAAGAVQWQQAQQQQQQQSQSAGLAARPLVTSFSRASLQDNDHSQLQHQQAANHPTLPPSSTAPNPAAAIAGTSATLSGQPLTDNNPRQLQQQHTGQHQAAAAMPGRLFSPFGGTGASSNSSTMRQSAQGGGSQQQQQGRQREGRQQGDAAEGTTGDPQTQLQSGGHQQQQQQQQPTNLKLQIKQTVLELKQQGVPLLFKERVVILRELGSGAFGSVYIGREGAGSVVAIKSPNSSALCGGSGLTDEAFLEFLKEAMVLALRHPHIIPCYGVSLPDDFLLAVGVVCTSSSIRSQAWHPMPPAILMEKADGSLYQGVHKAKDPKLLAPRGKVQIMLHTALGLGFMHERKLTHCDLKPANLLWFKLENGFLIKIGDPGLSKTRHNTYLTDGAGREALATRGTTAYMAPELLKDGTIFAKESVDVFSFGVIMGELWLEQMPYEGMLDGQVMWQRYDAVAKNLQPEPFVIPTPPPPEPAHGWVDLMQRCLQNAADERPTAAYLATALRAMLDNMP